MRLPGRHGRRIAILAALAGIVLPAGVLAPAGAAADAVLLTAGTRAGVMYGQVRELVLYGSFPISELDWPVQPVFFEESSLDVRAFGGLHATLQVQAGIPAFSGIMTDSDWANYPNYTNPTAKTHFSESNGFTERSISLDIRLGWEITVPGGVTFEPFASFGYMSWQWAARDGYLQYPPEANPPYTPWSPGEPKMPLYGTVGTYQQTYIIPGAGVRLAFRLGQRWYFAASFVFSPLVMASVLDTHVLRDIDISGNLSGGSMLEPGLEARFEISNGISMALGARYRHIAGLVGDETVTGGSSSAPPDPAPGTSVSYPNSYGASYDVLSAWLDFSFSL